MTDEVCYLDTLDLKTLDESTAQSIRGGEDEESWYEWAADKAQELFDHDHPFAV